MGFRILFLCALLLLLPSLLPAYTGCGGDNPPVVDGDYEQQVVELVNAARTSHTPPLPPIKRVAALDAVARYHAADMGRDDYFAHDTYDRVEGNVTIACTWFDRLASYYDGGIRGRISPLASPLPGMS